MDEQELAFLILTLLYAFLLVLSCIRLRYLSRFQSMWNHTKLLYISIHLQLWLRLFTFLCVTLDLWTDVDALFVLLTLPNCVFVTIFWVLFWHLFSVFLYSHLDMNARTQLLPKAKARTQQRKLAKFFLFTGGLWLTTQCALYVCVLFQKVPRYGVDLEIAIVNISASALAVFSYIILQVQYSGQPHRSPIWVEAQQKMTSTLCLWCLGRTIQGVLGLFQSLGTVNITNELASNEVSQVAITMMIVALLFSEVMCVLVVLDYSFLILFLKEEKPDLSVADNYAPHESDPSPVLERETFTSVKMSEIALVGELSKRPNGFGELFVVKYKGKEVAYRKLKFSRVSGYIAEELMREVRDLSALEVPYSLLPIGVTTVLPVLGILSPYMKNGSLYQRLHMTQRKMTFSQKIQVLRDVACSLHSFHAQNRCHGHLSSQNVLLDDANHGYVSDWGLMRLKKFAGVSIQYCNKGGSSSPEQLRSPGKTCVSPKASDDVYSFGMLVWEVYTEQIPFPGWSLKRLENMVAEAGYRPQIPANMPQELVSVLKSCWNIDPEKRPELRVLEASLSSL